MKEPSAKHTHTHGYYYNDDDDNGSDGGSSDGGGGFETIREQFMLWNNEYVYNVQFIVHCATIEFRTFFIDPYEFVLQACMWICLERIITVCIVQWAHINKIEHKWTSFRTIDRIQGAQYRKGYSAIVYNIVKSGNIPYIWKGSSDWFFSGILTDWLVNSFLGDSRKNISWLTQTNVLRYTALLFPFCMTSRTNTNQYILCVHPKCGLVLDH